MCVCVRERETECVPVRVGVDVRIIPLRIQAQAVLRKKRRKDDAKVEPYRQGMHDEKMTRASERASVCVSTVKGRCRRHEQP